MSDPLESGIEVIAKPPGKKLQSIALLSGGERSMTVALLFSIAGQAESLLCSTARCPIGRGEHRTFRQGARSIRRKLTSSSS